jgi:putative transposase
MRQPWVCHKKGFNPEGGCASVRLKRMPQSLSAVYLHLVFATKNRAPFLRASILREALHSYLAETSLRLDCPAIAVGGVEDHVHLLARFSRSMTQADWVKELKRVSSAWIKQQPAATQEFAWQAGYGIFSVSASRIEATSRYISMQEQRHRRLTFQDEFRILLRKHRLEWDEAYVWD